MGILASAFADMGFVCLLLFITALIYIEPVSSFPVEGCCSTKKVGSHSYTLLLENDSAPAKLGCSSSCVYQRDGEENSKYCFKPGDLPVECTGELMIPQKISIFNNFSEPISGTLFAFHNQSFYDLLPGETGIFYIVLGSLEKIEAHYRIVDSILDIDCVALESITPFDDQFVILQNGFGCRVYKLPI